MDFAKLDLRTKANEEHWVQLRMGDTLLFADMDKQEGPCRVKIAAIANDKVKAALKVVMRLGDQTERLSASLASEQNKSKRESIIARLDQIEKEAETAFEQFITISVKDWENIEAAGKPLAFSEDALADFAKPGAPLFRMANEIAQEAAKAQSPFTKAASA